MSRLVAQIKRNIIHSLLTAQLKLPGNPILFHWMLCSLQVNSIY